MQVNPTNSNLMIVIVVVLVVIAIGVALYIQQRKKKTARLRSRFGPEYDRAVLEHGSESKAEARLVEREARVERLHLRELPAAERERFAADWEAVQSRFVDHPKGAVIEADELVSGLMQARGYPVADFDQRAADISVHHPSVVEHYRTAHDIALRLGSDEATTEDMRNAMIRYRSLFDELLEVHAPGEVRPAV